MIGGDELKLEKINRDEAFRYMGQRGELSEGLRALADECEARLLEVVSPRFVYTVFGLDIKIEIGLGERVSVCGTALTLAGESIREHLKGCGKCVLMAATLGAGVDSLIRELESTAMEKAFVTDALASAAIEQVCDMAELEIKERLAGFSLTWRFSPGYGDLPLGIQKQFIDVLNAPKRIGLTVTDNQILVPRKSVTAIIGVSEQELDRQRSGCAACNMRNTCSMRKTGESCAGSADN